MRLVPIQVPMKNVGRPKGNGTKATTAATVAVGRPNPTKSKSRIGSSVGRPRKDEVVRQRESSENDEASPISFPISMDLRGKGIDVLQNGKKFRFTFNKVNSPTASQQDVFREVSELVQSTFDGHKICIFSYS
ncbi:hypothetical protein QYF36_021796 [Acer negundo]|nr:hypothetical protein QYF36_021796 [Acer negundo]